MRQIAFAQSSRADEQSRNRARQAAAQHDVDNEKNCRQQQQSRRQTVEPRPCDVDFDQRERFDDFERAAFSLRYFKRQND